MDASNIYVLEITVPEKKHIIKQVICNMTSVACSMNDASASVIIEPPGKNIIVRCPDNSPNAGGSPPCGGPRFMK